MADTPDGITRRTMIGIGMASVAASVLPPAVLALPLPAAELAVTRVKIQTIFEVITRHYGVTVDEILSPDRTRRVVEPRQMGMYLAHRFSGRSLPEIGRRFGGRDHTTVLHADRKIARLTQENPILAGHSRSLIAGIERTMAADGEAIDWTAVRADSGFGKPKRGVNPHFDKWLDWREQNLLT
ncbi:MAG: helix-turn-helix domain-containing protein [Hyphomicrobiaceae bacterium]